MFAKGKLVLIGDLNIHHELSDNAEGRTFDSVLDNPCLQQHISKPTHKSGHILVITRSETPVRFLQVDYFLIFDHYFISFNLDMVKPPPFKKRN